MKHALVTGGDDYIGSDGIVKLSVLLAAKALRNVLTTLRQWRLNFKLGFTPFALVG